jgi:hypothetical protein
MGISIQGTQEANITMARTHLLNNLRVRGNLLVSGSIERATLQVKSDSGTGSLLQEVNIDTPNSARDSGLTFTETGNANVRTFVGRSYMAGGVINATRIIAQRDASSPVVCQEARAANSLINRNLRFTFQDDGRTAVGEGNYFPFGLKSTVPYIGASASLTGNVS